MKTTRYTLLLLTLALLPLTVDAQTPMVNGDTLFLSPCNGGVSFCDDGGPYNNYSNRFDGWVVLTVNPGETLTLTGSYNTENNYDYIHVYDGWSQIANYTNTGNANCVAYSGTMRVYFHSDISVTRSGFSFTVTTNHVYAPCSANITGLNVSNVNASSALVTWSSDVDSLMLDYGDSIIAVGGGSAQLTGLDTNTTYTIRLYHQADSGEVCCTKTIYFTTAIGASRGCLDPTNLHGSSVLAYTGTFDNPYQTVGVVDQGPSSSYSRHTIHTNPNETDPRTGNLLHTVPSGRQLRCGWATGTPAHRPKPCSTPSRSTPPSTTFSCCATPQCSKTPTTRRKNSHDSASNYSTPRCSLSILRAAQSTS